MVHSDSSAASWQFWCILIVLVNPDSSAASWQIHRVTTELLSTERYLMPWKFLCMICPKVFWKYIHIFLDICIPCPGSSHMSWKLSWQFTVLLCPESSPASCKFSCLLKAISLQFTCSAKVCLDLDSYGVLLGSDHSPVSLQFSCIILILAAVLCPKWQFTCTVKFSRGLTILQFFLFLALSPEPCNSAVSY